MLLNCEAFRSPRSLFLHFKVRGPASVFTGNVSRCSVMSGTQRLRLLVNERLAAAAEEIFGLVEKTLAEYQDEAVRSKTEVDQLKKQLEQLTVLKPEVILFRAETQPVSEELLPSLQQCDIKVEQIPVLEETEIQEHLQVKEEQVDQCISPDMKADTSNIAEVRHPISEPTTKCELFPSSSAVTVCLNKHIDDRWNEGDGSSSPRQSHSVEVVVELEQPPREEKLQKSCRFCGKSFKKDAFLIRHVEKSHKRHKAFKCLDCNKEFEYRYQLVLHMRVHTGEKPFSCDYCGKNFSQNSSRLVHMRVHTGEKPYFCAKCGKSFASSKHFKFCKITPEKDNVDERHKEEKAFKCFECNREFNYKHQLVQHTRVHSGEKPFSCDFCGKTFTQNCSRILHMRQHAGEKPYFCEKCGKRFASCKHDKYCTGTQNKGTDKSFRCLTCGKTFYTDSDLKVHMEVHEAWKRHMSEKLQGQELEEKKT